MAWICLVLGEKTLAENLELAHSHEGYFDLVELRADRLNPDQWDHIQDFPISLSVPCILTLRQPQDGGSFVGSPGLRIAFFTKALEGSFKYWDLEEGQELPGLEVEFLRRGGRIIRSFHDFEGVPEDLSARLKALSAGGSIPKAAVYPKSTAQHLQIWRILESLELKEKIFLAMGPYGMPTRILAQRAGSLWTYASPKGQTLAPGQLNPMDLEDIYRFRNLKKSTPIYAIVGKPIHHTKSPSIHNPAFKGVGVSGVYVPFLVDDLEEFFPLAELLDIQGLSVTIPHKQAACRFLGDSAPQSVATIGACNTLYKKEGRWCGENTDAPGFMVPVLKKFGSSLKGLKVAVLGTGGAARGVLYGLLSQGAVPCLLGRDRTKTESLAKEFGVVFGALNSSSKELLKEYSTLIAQTTSVGMGDQEGQNPIDWYPLKGTETVYDIIYNPRKTALIESALAAGCEVIYGASMLMEQAFLQFFHFTGKPYPEALKGRVLRILTV